MNYQTGLKNQQAENENGLYALGMGIVIKSIECCNGSISYRISHGFADTTLLFIHGLEGDSRLFQNQLRHFGGRFSVIAIDLPGHGRSVTEKVPALNEYIDAIHMVMQEEDVKSYIPFGHSMGGGICLELLKSDRDMIEGMVLISTGSVFPIPDYYFNMVDNDLEGFIDFLVRSVFSRKTDLIAEIAKKGIGRINSGVLMSDLQICTSMDYTELLKDIEVPVLLIANRGDTILPCGLTKSLKERIENSRLIIYDYNGHVPFFENSDTFNRTVEDFIDDIIR